MDGAPAHTIPTATVKEVWREVEAWGFTARTGKNRSRRARLWAIWLAVLGAFLATMGRFIDPLGESEQAVFLAVSAAGALAVAGFLGRELLSPEKELSWVQARMLAEQLKREIWRCLAGVPPYGGQAAGSALRRAVDRIVEQQDIERLEPPEDGRDEPPTLGSIDDYVKHRVDDQVAYYRRKAASLQGDLRLLRRMAFFFGLMAVLAGVLGAVPEWRTSGFLPLLTTAAAAVAAHMQSTRYGDLIPVYQKTATRLALLGSEWAEGWRLRCEGVGLSDFARKRLSEIEFVEACEAVMSQENDTWQDEWLDGAAQQRTLEARQALLEAAASQPPAPGGAAEGGRGKGGRGGGGARGGKGGARGDKGGAWDGKTRVDQDRGSDEDRREQAKAQAAQVDEGQAPADDGPEGQTPVDDGAEPPKPEDEVDESGAVG